MKAPDKIYLHGYSFDEDPCKTWEKEPKIKNLRGYRPIYAEYLRKDALLEWANERLDKSYDGSTDFDYGMAYAYTCLIEKLEEL